MNLETSTETLSDDIFSQLMGEIPDGTVNPTSLVGSTQPDKKDENKEVKEVKDEKKVVATVEKTEDEVSEDIDKMFDDEDEDDSTVDKNKDQTKPAKQTSKNTDISENLKTQYELLVENGMWEELEDIDQFEFTNENFVELAEKQAEWKAQSAFENLVEKSGKYGKAILSHINNGGNPDEIIDLFKAQLSTAKLDITTEEGQTQIITKYYKDLGWSDTKINRFIRTAVDDNTLAEEADEIKLLIDKDLEAEISETQKQQEDYLKSQKEAQRKFAENIQSAINEVSDLNEKEKREILADLLVYDKKLPNGKIVNQFTLDFANLQADTKKYIQLVRFIKNPESFLKQAEKEADKKAAKKAWNFVKGNGALQRGTGTSHTKSNTTKAEDLVIPYKSFL